MPDSSPSESSSERFPKLKVEKSKQRTTGARLGALSESKKGQFDEIIAADRCLARHSADPGAMGLPVGAICDAPGVIEGDTGQRD